MGLPAKYTFDIKDVTYIGPTFTVDIQLGKYTAYSYQAPTAVSNELLSEVTTPGYFAATVGDVVVASGATVYLPYWGDSYLKSATCTEGFQYALASMHSSIMNHSIASPATIYAMCQYSHNGNDWYDASYQSVCRVSDNFGLTEDIYNSISGVFTVPGNAGAVSVFIRWKIYNMPGGGEVWMKSYTIAMDVVPRHTHVLQQVGQAANTVKAQQTDNTVYAQPATPETITCTVNGGTPFAVSCPAPDYKGSVDIKSLLVNGVNTIQFTSTTPCTVTPSANYLTFPA